MAPVASVPNKQISTVISVFCFLFRFWGGRSRKTPGRDNMEEIQYQKVTGGGAGEEPFKIFLS